MAAHVLGSMDSPHSLDPVNSSIINNSLPQPHCPKLCLQVPFISNATDFKMSPLDGGKCWSEFIMPELLKKKKLTVFTNVYIRWGRKKCRMHYMLLFLVRRDLTVVC